MRFSVVLILFLMSLVGAAPSKTWAHEGDTAQSAPALSVSDRVHVGSPIDVGSETVDPMPDGREGATLGIPAGHHDDPSAGPDCLTVASCGGVSGILVDGHGIPLPQQAVPASLVTAGNPPQSVDLPVEDRPPRRP